jgi:predicted alpha/beta-hydrolase family hydrolase
MITAPPDLLTHRVLGPILPDGREASIWHWQPAQASKGAIVFSHGAESAPWKYARIIACWLADGFEVWAPWHVDSRDHPRNADYPGLRTWQARIEDMRVAAALVEAPYVVAGHSYGALTALVVAGAQGDRPKGISGPLHDPAAQCVIALSPPPPIPGLISHEGYGAVRVPALIQTGDHDVFPGTPFTPDAWRVHLPAYEAGDPSGERYLLLLDGVDHYFGNAICEPDLPAPPQVEQLAALLAVTGLFIEAFFPQSNEAAAAALHARLTDEGAVRLARR